MDYDKYNLDYIEAQFEKHHQQYIETLEVVRKNNPGREPDEFSPSMAVLVLIREIRKLQKKVKSPIA